MAHGIATFEFSHELLAAVEGAAWIGLAGAVLWSRLRTERLLAVLVGSYGFAFLLRFEGFQLVEYPLVNSAVQGVAALFLAAWAFHRWRRAFPLMGFVPITLLIAFVILEAGAMAVSERPALAATFLLRYYLPFLAVLVAAADVLRKEDARRLVVAVLVASVAVSVLVTVATHVHLLEHGPAWDDTGGGREGSTHGGIASTSFHVILALLAVPWLWTTLSSLPQRAAILCAGLLLLAGQALTASIAGYLSLGAGVLAYSLTWDRKRHQWSRPGIAAAAFLAVIAVAAAAYSPLPDRTVSKYEDLSTQPPHLWFSGRVATWHAGIEVVRENPISGVGGGSVGREVGAAMTRLYPEMHVPEKSGGPDIETHNTLLYAAVEAGIFAALALAAGWLLSLRAWLQPAPSGIGRHSLIAMNVAAFAFLVSSDQLIDRYFWLLLSLNVGFSLEAPTAQAASAEDGVSHHGGRTG